MNEDKKARLEANGWKVGTVAEFLMLTPEEENEVEALVYDTVGTFEFVPLYTGPSKKISAEVGAEMIERLNKLKSGMVAKENSVKTQIKLRRKK